MEPLKFIVFGQQMPEVLNGRIMVSKTQFNAIVLLFLKLAKV